MRPRQAADGAEFRAEGEEGVDDARDGGAEREGQPHAERGCGQRLHQREAYDVRPGKAHEPDNAEHAALAPDGGDEVAAAGIISCIIVMVVSIVSGSVYFNRKNIL